MPPPFLEEIAAAFPAAENSLDPSTLTLAGKGNLPSWFEVTDLAAASMGLAGLMVARLASPMTDEVPRVTADRRLASFWFGMTLRPQGWELPPVWDPIAGDYRTKDGWIRLHTNAPHHRAAALSVLGNHNERAALAPHVAKWEADDLEAAVVAAGGCAAVMRSLDDWAAHPQGAAIRQEPLIHWHKHEEVDGRAQPGTPERPLAGVRILDLTRVLAGPVAGRFLAAYGAELLRIDPPSWNEPGVIPEVTLGKRCAGLDLKKREDRQIFDSLLAGSDVLLHGYRPDALAGLGYDADALRRLNPTLIDVCLNAYGWSGPWAGRRGFDSLVQMSSGIAAYGMEMSGADKPQPLPVQALDHATGYLMAAAVLHALQERAAAGRVISAKLSLAATARLLSETKRSRLHDGLAVETETDIDPAIEKTTWGPARRIRFPLIITGIDPIWTLPASDLRTAAPAW